MSEHKPPAERLLDLLVFGPAGLAVTAIEEFPKLVEKGRHRIEGHVHTARLVGQFATQMGRRQLGQALDRLTRSDDSPAASRAAPTEPVTPVPVRGGGGSVTGDGPAEPVRTASHASPAGGNGSGPVSALAIPGYDSLSASQVVQRLDGLSVDELEDVRAHELAHRHRRTILHRIEQLLSGPDGSAP